jgi:uncharacterized protein with GYD domain
VAKYLLQVAYTPEAWAAQIKNPQNRVEVVGRLLEKFGGRFESAYMCFGDYDIVAVMDVPDNVSAAAVSMTVSAGGAVKAIKTTPLMSVDEGLQAMRNAGGAMGIYQPPT